MRIVDAVKGPFHPSPPPFPTYLEAPTKAAEGEFTNQVFAPTGSDDPGNEPTPDDPY